MGVETAVAIGAWVAANAGTITAVSGVVAAGAGVYGGVEASKSANKQADQAASDAARKAEIEQQGNNMLSSEQKVAFLNSGVTLEGSPLVVMEQTRANGAANVASINRGGANMASALEYQGRGALFSGLASGIGTASSIYKNTQTTQQNRI